MAARHLHRPPPALVRPVKIDPRGVTGPTAKGARGPRWRRTSPGYYVPAGTARSAEQRILEQSMRLPADGVVGGWAALCLSGAAYFDGLHTDGRSLLPVPLVVPPDRDLRPGPAAERHRAALRQDEIAHRHGIPVTTPVRSLLDIASWSADPREIVVAIDIALAAALATTSGFAAYLATRRHAPGVARARRALQLCDPRTLSPAETRLRLIWLLDAGLPRPRCNWPVAGPDALRIGRPDLLCEELAVAGEFDGREHRSAAEQREDARKEDAYRNAGLETFRIVGRDLDDRRLVTERIHTAVRRAAEAGRPRAWLIATNPGPL